MAERGESDTDLDALSDRVGVREGVTGAVCTADTLTAGVVDAVSDGLVLADLLCDAPLDGDTDALIAADIDVDVLAVTDGMMLTEVVTEVEYDKEEVREVVGLMVGVTEGDGLKQPCVLHSAICVNGPQFVEPDAVRVEMVVPPPHVAEQADHAVQGEYLHFDEHDVVIVHDCICIRSTVLHAMLTFSRPGGIVSRTRVCLLLPPHTPSHADHSLQSLTGPGSCGVAVGHFATDAGQFLCSNTYDGCLA